MDGAERNTHFFSSTFSSLNLVRFLHRSCTRMDTGNVDIRRPGFVRILQFAVPSCLSGLVILACAILVNVALVDEPLEGLTFVGYVFSLLLGAAVFTSLFRSARLKRFFW